MHSKGSVATKLTMARRDDGERKPTSRRPDDGDAFLRDPQSGPAHSNDDLADSLAEDFLSSATSGEESTEEAHDQFLAEELGGPFIEGRASAEFANDTDESNPEDAVREPFPTAMRSADR